MKALCKAVKFMKFYAMALLIMAAASSALTTGCADTGGISSDISSSTVQTQQSENKEETMTVTVNGESYTVHFYDTEAAEKFGSMLPVSFTMSELNGNEKYIYTDTKFPTSAEKVGSIKKGEIMLYGDNCIVLFYDSFSTPYSYTRIGYIENADGLENAVGKQDAQVKFDK